MSWRRRPLVAGRSRHDQLAASARGASLQRHPTRLTQRKRERRGARPEGTALEAGGSEVLTSPAAMRSTTTRAILAAGLLSLAPACKQGSASAGPAPVGPLARALVDASGGAVTSADGVLTVTVPAGALSAPAEVTVQALENTAPAGQGQAYRVGPAGQRFAAPVTLTFRNATGLALDQLWPSYRIDQALWVRARTASADGAAGSLALPTSDFSWTDYALVAAGPNVAQDLVGAFTFASTIDDPASGLVPFAATGTATLAAAGGDASGTSYFFTEGTATLVTPVTVQGVACTPVASAVAPASDTAVVEVRASPASFVWALLARWDLTCADGGTALASTDFDTKGVNLPYVRTQACTRGYVGTPVIGPTHVQCDAANGCAFVVTCGALGTQTVTWNFARCAPGVACASSDPCRLAASSCSTGVPVCTDIGDAANGTACGGGQTCHAGACVASGTVAGTRLVAPWPADAPACAGAACPPAPDVATIPPAAPVAVRALAPDGQGGRVAYAGAFTAPGAFSIPAVPAGPYLLELVDGAGFRTLVDTSAAAVDLGYDAAGRADLARAGLATPVTLSLSGLAPWSAGDELQLTAAGADAWHVLAPSPAPAAGDVAAAFTEDWHAPVAGGPLGLLAAADTLYVHQLASSVDAASGLGFGAAAAWASFTGVAVADGAGASVGLGLGAPTSTAALPAGTWALSAFEAELPSVNPAATTGATPHALTVAASPHPLGAPGPAARGAPVLLRVRAPLAGAGPDPTLGALSYGRFLDAAWSEWLGVELAASVAYTAPGAASASAEAASIGWRVPASPAPTPPWAPAVTPVRAPQLTPAGGAPASLFADLTGVGATPTLSWTAPATGAPTSYAVELFRLDAAGGATVRTPVATWLTAATSVALPPGLLAAGSTYYARITARAVAGDAFATAPLRRQEAAAWAQVLTGTFAP